MDCPLCLEPCKIPVEITGFPCYRSEDIHCHTMIRYCRACCLRLFELDRPRHERREYLQCLYCDSSVNLQELTTTPFRTDHYQIRHDTVKDVACPHCDHIAVDHQALEKHCSHECPHSLRIQCQCGTHDSEHSNHQCSVCSLCDMNVSAQVYTEHLVEYHHMEICHQCEKFTLLPMQEHLETECVRRSLPCKYCSVNVQALHFTDHLLAHREESKQRSLLLHDLVEKEKELSERLLQESRDFYGHMYQESLI